MALLPGGGKVNVEHIFFIAVNPMPVAKLHCVILIFTSKLWHIILLVFIMALISQTKQKDLGFHLKHLVLKLLRWLFGLLQCLHIVELLITICHKELSIILLP